MHPLLVALKYIAAEQDTPHSGDELLFKWLHAPWFNTPPIEIARLSIEVADRQFGKNKTFLGPLLHEKIHTPPKDLFALPAHPGLQKANHLFQQWMEAAHTLAPHHLFEHMAREASITAYIQQSPDKEQLEAAQNSLSVFILDETRRDPSLTLKDILTRIGDLQKQGAPLPFLQLSGGDSTSGAPEIEPMEPAFIKALVERFTMNVSALNNYLRCPLEFYYKNILRIPSPQNEATGFGSAVHYALEQLFRKMLEASIGSRQRLFPPPETCIADFEWYMHRSRECFTAAQFERKLAYGREVLSNYYATYINSFPTVVAIERMIRITCNGIPLKGKLDKLEFDGKSVNIVDYKTGDYDKAMLRMQPPREEDPNGGDYWRQAVFYKILVDNYEEKGWKAMSTSFDFIEPDKTGRYRREILPVTAADTATVTQQLTRAWHNIQRHAFYTGCGAAHCSWCNFVKGNGLAVAIHGKAFSY